MGDGIAQKRRCRTSCGRGAHPHAQYQIEHPHLAAHHYGGRSGLSGKQRRTIITLTQYPPADSHETGYVFFEDDFAWVTENWVEPYSKYGWPGVKTDGVNNNEFGLTNAKIKPVADEKGYTYSASVYARYEGSVKLGKTNQCGFLQTPALSKIDAGKSATVLVSFYGALYASASGTQTPPNRRSRSR